MRLCEASGNERVILPTALVSAAFAVNCLVAVFGVGEQACLLPFQLAAQNTGLAIIVQAA
jgi:hypothetical protein